MSSIPERLTANLAAKYRLERELGQGGMAIVYLATDLKHERQVALKVMRPEMKGLLGPRFAREIKLAARLQHPHICSVYDSGETPDGELWYTMPFVPGQSLRDRITRDRTLPIPDAVRIIREAAQGLEYAHRQGVIHRDIKPENILLTEDGNTLVADFGIARALDTASEGDPSQPKVTALTETGFAIGTPAYMSPEQRLGGQVNAGSDVYSLAASLYEMLTGEEAHPRSDNLLALVSDPAPQIRTRRAEVTPELEAVVRDAMHPEATKRTSSMAAFGAALELAISGSYRVPAPVAGWRRKTVVAGAFVAVAAVLAVAWVRLRPSANSIVTILPFTTAPGDSTLDNLTGSIGEDLRRMINHVPGLHASSEAAVRNVAGGRLSTADIAARMGSDIVVQPSATRRDSSYELTFSVTRPNVKGASRVQLSGTAQWLLTHRDSLVVAVLAAAGHRVDDEAAQSLAHWAIGTTSVPAYIRFWQYRRATDEEWSEGPGWVPVAIAMQDTLLQLDPRFIDAIAEKVVLLHNEVIRPFQATPEQLDSARHDFTSLVRQANAVDPNHPLTMRVNGYQSLAASDTLAARRAFAEAAALDPTTTSLSDLCGLELNQSRPSQPLPASCLRMMAIDSLNPDNMSVASGLFAAYGRWQDALPPARMAVQLAPRMVVHRLNLSQMLRLVGQVKEATDELSMAVRIDPANVYLQENLSGSQWEAGLREEAIATARKVVDEHPELPFRHVSLLNMLNYTGQHAEAIEIGRKLVADGPRSSYAHSQLANALWSAGNFEESLAERRIGASLEDKSPRGSRVIINYLRLLGRTGEAQDLVDRLNLAEPGSRRSAVENATQLKWIGRHAAAIPELRRAIGGDTLEVNGWVLLAETQILAGQFDSALVTTARAMAIDSTNIMLLRNRALVLAATGAETQAMELSDRMRKRTTLDLYIQANQVWFHARAGDTKGARAMLDSLQYRWQRSGTATMPMVIALAGVGDTAGARAALRRAVEKREPMWLSHSLEDPRFEMLRETPEFAEAVRAFRLGGDQ